MSVATKIASVSDQQDLMKLLRRKATYIRRETVRLATIPKSGHYGSTFSCAEIMATLYYGVMNVSPRDPADPERDRFVMGKGHVAIGYYPILADLGFFAAQELDDFSRLGSRFGDHPDMRKVPGADFGSGSLGHGLSVALGMALHARRRSPDDPFWTYCLVGDGEHHEGQLWEAVLAAGSMKVGNLTAIVDRNGVCVDGRVVEVLDIEPIADKWTAFGWRVYEVDGHDVRELYEALLSARSSLTAPTVVIANTVPAKGVSFMEGDPAWHNGFLGEADTERAIKELDDQLEEISQ